MPEKHSSDIPAIELFTREEIFARWVQALESGHYSQGRYRLKWGEKSEAEFRTPAYCCLGVLCDSIDPDLWAEGGYDGAEIYNNVAISGLPEYISEKLGLSDTAGFAMTKELLKKISEYGLSDRAMVELQAALLDDIDSTISLAKLNDAGATFEDIAAIIKAGPDWQERRKPYE